jgi:uncharacterized membrane protein
MYKYIFLLFFILPTLSFGQEVYQDLQDVVNAEVVEIISEEQVLVPGTEVKSTIQTIRAVILEGEDRGTEIRFTNDYILLDPGQKFFLNRLKTINGVEIYSVREVDRRGKILFLAFVFSVVVVFFGGKQGIKSLLSLFGSLFVIMYFLVPELVSGTSPVVLSVAVSSVILFCVIFLTHGFNKSSAVSFSSTVVAVIITGLLAYFSVHFSDLTGFYSDEVSYLNLNTKGELDFVGLLLSAMIIGALGVLDDIAVTQVAVVREIFYTDKSQTRMQVYKKALRVGQDHVGALVNTLVLAYVGASLPLVMLFSISNDNFGSILNREIFATEIVRAIVGSIGLVLTVPISTFFAVIVFEKYKGEKIKDGHLHTHTH